ncbi:uncharacterized protein ACMZJ9_005273 isoform 2-T2 [Mantella aurantiaca]
MQAFQSQQQNAKFEKEKQELLGDISLKEKTIVKLQDQYESLKLRFDSLHSVMEQVEKNQSRLLEKFATQSTRCMNVINMMSELCNKDKNKTLGKLPFIKEKMTLMAAVTSQLSAVTKTPNNISVVPSPEDSLTKAQFPLMKTIKDTAFLTTGGKKRHSMVDPEVIELSLKAKSTVNPENDRYNALEPKISTQGSYFNVTAQDKMTSTAEEILATLQNDSFENEGTLKETIIKNDINENSSKRPKTKGNWLLDFNKRLQLTNSNNLASRAIINITQDDEEKELKLTLLEDRKSETTTEKGTTEETTKVNLKNILSSLFNVNNKEIKDKDGDIKEERL